MARGVLCAVGLFMALGLFSGCASLGPEAIVRDRADYSMSITESWKRQILLNIVRIRYVEPLFFVEVGDIVAGYSMETSANAGLSRSWFDLNMAGDSNMADFGMSARFANKPTITYRPMNGQTFLRGVMSPIPVENVFAGLDSGVTAKFLVSLVVRSINGVRNELLRQGKEKTERTDFQRVVEALAVLQKEDALEVTARTVKEGGGGRIFVRLGREGDSGKIEAATRELQRLLDLDPELREYELVASNQAVGDKRIAVKTYSLMQILAAVASRVEVPAEDLAQQRAIPGSRKNGGVLCDVVVHASDARPERAYAAVESHGSWFWVDEGNLAAKRVFSFLMLTFTLLDDDGDVSPLQITIPAQ